MWGVLLLLVRATSSGLLDVAFDATNSGLNSSLSVEGEMWLDLSCALMLQYKNAPVALTHAATTHDTGSDALGPFERTTHSWRAGDGAADLISTSLRRYTRAGDDDFAIFDMRAAQPLPGTATGSAQHPVLEFPRVALGKGAGRVAELSWLDWHGLWPIPNTGVGLTTMGGLPQRRDGPVLFTSLERRSLLLGPLDEPLNTVHAAGGGRLCFGPSGSLATLEQGWSYAVVIVAAGGPTLAMRRYGDLLQAAAGGAVQRLPDPAVSQLSYWTDNGAYYYYNAAGKQALPSPEKALPSALGQLRAQRVPVKLLQLDGWWFDGATGAPDAAFFPHGWPAFRAAVGNDTALCLYHSTFGKTFHLFSKYQSVPCKASQGCFWPAAHIAQPFYEELFRDLQALGASSYETDFMSDHLLPTPALQNSTSGLPMFLSGMAGAGAKLGLPMQWCMPTAGIVLAAVDKPAVSNARASVDYAEEWPLASNTTSSWDPNYMIGAAGLLFWAVGVPPSKDGVRTTAREPGTTYGHDFPNFELDTALAVLSTGPVGLMDGAGMSNASLARRTCRDDGTLLKPSKPLTAIDSTFVPPAAGAATGTVGFLPLTADGECQQRPCSPAAFQTHAKLSIDSAYDAACRGAVAHTWHIMLTMHLGKFRPQASDFYPPLRAASSPLHVYRESRWARCRNGTAALKGECLRAASASELPDISSGAHRADAAGADAWRLFSFSPLLPLPSVCHSAGADGWVLLGELDKITNASPQRFARVGVRESGRASCVFWRMHGAAQEHVTVSAVSPSGTFLEAVFSGEACPVANATTTTVDSLSQNCEICHLPN
jgi:hypothetical protein